MANWYTSTQNGNDTTGDGTIALPYATIFKAASLATTGDTINTEGDALTNSGVTVTVTGPTTLSTSSSLVGILAPGSIFTIDDPVWGLGTQWFKVRSVTSTTVNLQRYFYGAGSFTLHYIATPSYSSSSASNYLEDLSSLTLDGINFEGGWDPTFTTQDRITWATYITTSSAGATQFLRMSTLDNPATNKSNLSFNNFGVGGNTMFQQSQASGGSFNNLYSAGGNIVVRQGSTIQNLYIGGNQLTTTGTSELYATPININNLWWAGDVTGFGSNGVSYNVDQLYLNATSNTFYAQAVGLLGGGAMDINMLNINWAQPAETVCVITLLDDADGSLLLRGVTHYGNFPGTAPKGILLKSDGNGQVQISTTQNVDTWNLQSPETYIDRFNGFGPIRDAEGYKQYWAAGNVIYADPTQFDTGSNSLRVSKSQVTNLSQQVPIKSFVNPDATAKTITIRAKATTNSSVDFCILPNGSIATSSAIEPIYYESYTVTDTWADYTLTMPAELAGYMIDSFVNVGIIASASWASPHIWIDSVTIS